MHINFFPSTCLLVTIIMTVVSPAYAEKLSIDALVIPDDTKNIYVHKLATDSNSTDFLIIIKDYVPLHMHAKHTETIFVLEGKGEFRKGEKKFMIEPGDYLRIPPGISHSVKVTSLNPLKVLSIQAPEFFGLDRIPVKNP